MKVSYKWLYEIIPGLEKFSAQEIADKLTLSGLEIEAVENLSAKFKGIVVGEVIEKDKEKLKKFENNDSYLFYKRNSGKIEVNVNENI